MIGHIFLEGEVGDQVNTKTVRQDIANYPQATEWNIHINSPGGDVDEGYAIGSILKNLQKTTAYIGSTCASIATYAAHCCTHVVMGPSGDFTIHLPTAIVGGNAKDHLNAAARLDRIKNELINRYMTRVAKKGVTRDEVSQMIDKETSMSPEEALQMGFVDAVQERFKAVAKLDTKKYTMETLSKEETLGLFEKMGKKIDRLFNKEEIKKPTPKVNSRLRALKVKNLELTLTDGTVLEVDAEDPNDLQGATVSAADGSPVTDGVYETAEGMEIEVVGGVITETEQTPTNESEDDPGEDNDPAIPTKDPKDDDMETYDELMKQKAALDEKIKKVKPGAQPPASAPAAKTTIKPNNKLKTDAVDPEKKQFMDKIDLMEKQLAEMKKLTVGKQNPPAAAPLDEENEEEYDESFKSFANHVTGFYQGRGFIKQNIN